MKKKFLLIVILFFSTAAFAQNCNFTYSNAGALNVFTFYPNPAFANSQYRFLWTFGDSSSSGDSTPVHAYNSLGGYLVCCDIYDINQTLVCSSCDSIITGNPMGGPCSFSITPVTGNSFSFVSQGTTGNAVVWNFGDGSSGGGSSVTHTYPLQGTYLVCMDDVDTTTGTVLCTFCSAVTISGTTGNCSFYATVDTVNHVAVFYAQGNISSSIIHWDFGNGDTGSGSPYTYLYPSAGIYNVCMTQTDFFGTLVCSYCDAVNMGSNNQTGNCTFTYLRDSLNANQILFAGSPSSTTSGIYWDFGDGTPGQGTNVAHTYAAPGTYTVCMTEYYNGAVVCTSCMNVTVIGNAPGCQAYFLGVNLGLTGYFIDLSAVTFSSTVTYNWDFGDGGSSNTRFPQHTYATPGTYNVCLTVADANTSCSNQYCSQVTVDTTIISPVGCQAYFVILQMAPYQFVVVNLSNGTNLDFNWDFGDGSTSQQAYPSHSYNGTGSYNLCLTVNDGPSCTSTYCDTLSVDSLGNVFRSLQHGFTINVMSPAQLIGVREISAAKLFAVYPNPVTAALNVTLSSEVKGIASYKVFAVDGSEVTSGTFAKTENRLNTENWQQGAYILEVRNADGYRSYQKIIKE